MIIILEILEHLEEREGCRKEKDSSKSNKKTRIIRREVNLAIKIQQRWKSQKIHVSYQTIPAMIGLPAVTIPSQRTSKAQPRIGKKAKRGKKKQISLRSWTSNWLVGTRSTTSSTKKLMKLFYSNCRCNLARNPNANLNPKK